MERLRRFALRFRAPLAIYLVCASVYVALLGERRLRHSENDHFVQLAHSFLEGTLEQLGGPHGTNDWACFDREIHGPCPNGRFSFPGAPPDRYHWYVSFPPFPALVILPAVAAFGVELHDMLFWALFAGVGPAAVYAMLRSLRERGHTGRSVGDDLLLTFLFAFGTVFFFVAEQGSVWFAAHVVSVPLLCLFLASAVDARRPALAGAALALLFVTRPTTAAFGLFFVAEALRASRPPSAPLRDDDASPLANARTFLRHVAPRDAARRLALFALPVLVVGGLSMAMNQARFEDPFEFGHEFLQVFWRGRIEKWGLFNYHYVAKNLSVFLAGLPWLSREEPHLLVTGHGLAIWVTTPAVLYVLFPKRVTPLHRTLIPSVLLVLVANLMYQNSGWVQFGYRFALDYLPAVFVLLALGGRRFGWTFRALAVLAVVVNAFGAVTFDRAPGYYHVEGTQNVLFQPD